MTQTTLDRFRHRLAAWEAGPLPKSLERLPERRQFERLARVKRERDNGAVQARLEALRAAARGTANLMPYFLGAVNAYATLQEMLDVLRTVFGVYQELVIL
jgi:methylmalonyl-CoA mutase N-terminal domain/subunit